MRVLLTALLAFVIGGVTVAVLTHPAWAPSSAALLQTASAAASPGMGTGTGKAEISPQQDRWPNLAPSPEQVMYEQPRLMRDALSSMSARVPGVPNLYMVSFAGDGGEDVFRNEAEYAAQLFGDRYGTRAHTLVLENNPSTLSTHPLASWSNLESALAGVAAVMDPEQDILLLYLTSHGSHDHQLLVDMDPLPLDQIGATDLADILAEQPFKWKVVVVNACYSGGFIGPLRGDGTLVLTAARSDRSSFGCGSDSDITYFGRAWLVDALNRTTDPVQAFHDASKEIAGWEASEKLTPSEPQIAVGAGIEKQLARWRTGIPAGPALPFGPDSRSKATAATR